MNFGKPTAWDCVRDHLAYQKLDNGAGVYSLVTKLNFDGKPKMKDYDEAFKQLTTCFKSENYKHLICSPLGCVRDKVPIKHFISNIVQFQRETGAKVEIVTYRQNSARRILNNGLEHEQFINTLRKLIKEEATSRKNTILSENFNQDGCSIAVSQSSTSPSSPGKDGTTFELNTSTPTRANNDNDQKSSETSKQQCGDCEVLKQSTVSSEPIKTTSIIQPIAEMTTPPQMTLNRHSTPTTHSVLNLDNSIIDYVNNEDHHISKSNFLEPQIWPWLPIK